MINLSGSNCPCLEQIYMVQKMFELLRLDQKNTALERWGRWGGGGAYTVLQTTVLPYEESQLNRDSDFLSVLCSVFPRTTLIGFIYMQIL